MGIHAVTSRNTGARPPVARTACAAYTAHMLTTRAFLPTVLMLLSACPDGDVGEGEGEQNAEGEGDAGEGEGDAGEGEGDAGEGEGDTDADILAACAELDTALGISRPAGWDPLVHCKKARPDVDTVFGGVQTLTITMTSTEYAAMQADLDALQNGGGGGEEDTLLAACVGLDVDAICSVDIGAGAESGVCIDFDGPIGCLPDSFRAPQEWVDACVGLEPGDVCSTPEHGGFCGSDGLSFACFPNDEGTGSGELPCLGSLPGDACANGRGIGTCVSAGLLVCEVDGFDRANLGAVPVEAAAPFWSRDPIYFHADVSFAGKQFTSVGVRYKGNNGLASSQGEKKPLRLKLDQWEDDVAAITDQRMFGFQHLSLSPNQTDASHLHQVLAAEVFRDNGIPTPQSGFVEVLLDTGDGPRLLGVYAMSEVPDDPFLEREFNSDNGNLYKPDGRGAHFDTLVAGSIHKENNDDAPIDDVARFVEALHADQTDRSVWRASLQATFDIDDFAAFVAVNQMIGNWDTYGGFAHNFYLYGDPANGGQLRFIPWDFDLSFDGTGPSDLTLTSFSGDWPLLQAVARDAELSTTYHEKLLSMLVDELESGRLNERITRLEGRIRAAVAREDDVSPGRLEAFRGGIRQIRQHLAGQQQTADAYLRELGLR
jgi:spore coat protein H